MIQLSEDELRQFTETWKDMQEALKHVRSNQTNRATVHIEAGGVGIWIASTCCVVMLGLMVIGALWASREFARLESDNRAQDSQISDSRDYLQAIYAQAPHLKPEQKEEEKEGANP